MGEQETQPRPTFGTVLYTEDGQQVGSIRGFDEDGFYVTVRDGIEALSVEHVRSGHEFGEAELMWRCWEYGDMGQLSADLPDACPDCGAPNEDLYYWTED
jgi:hypothetical protein